MSSYSEPLVQSTTTPGEGAADVRPVRPASRGRRRAAAAGSVPAHRKRTLGQRIKRDRVMLLLIAPGFLYFVVFHWLPLPGNIVAFEDYQPYLGFIDSAWVGLDNFVKIFGDPTF